MKPFIVGFDLDMTLVDTRSAVRHVLTDLARDTGLDIDVEGIVNNSGPPIKQHIGHLFSNEAELEKALALARKHMRSHIHVVTALPGALATIDYIHTKGGQTLVVTAKHGSLVEPTLQSAGLTIDYIKGDLFAEQKAEALKTMGAKLYVGDHVKDILAAQIAKIPVIAVSTGSANPEQLQVAGADIVIESLEDFPKAFERLFG